MLNPDGREVEGTNFKWQQNPNYIPTTDYKPVTDTELGDEVNNSPQAPQILPDVYNPNNTYGGTAPKVTSDALDNALPTPETDPTGSSKPKPNKDTDGDGVPDVHDPTLPSQGDDFTLPAFCEWASTMCEWYLKYKQDSKQAEAQRESEKVAWQREEIARQQEEAQREKERTLWEKITNWFDWTKEEPEKDEPERQEIDDQGIFSRTFDTVFSLSKQCPPDVPFNLDTQYLKANYNISLEWLCIIFTFLGYPLVLVSHLTGIWILYEAVVRKEIKW